MNKKLQNIKYIAAIDPGKKTSAMVIFNVWSDAIEFSNSRENPYTFDTCILWQEHGFWLRQSTGIIVIEKGYISQKNKGVTSEHILLCGKCIGGLIAKGYNVIEADPLKWIPDMLSTGNVVPSNAHVKKMSKILVEQMEPNRRMNEHHRAAYLMGQWAYKQLKLGLI
jgi:hypothetical protein